jgi:tetratricopeptide (TPR) repeat protein
LYDRSLKLDPLNAEYALGQVEAYLMLFLRDETRDKTYLEKALVYFKRALKNDPNGFNTAYETSYRLMAVWQYLSQEDRDLVIERLGYVLKQEPWFRKYIYRRVWLNTNNFCVLQRMTPETLKGQEYLLSYLEGDDLHQFYLQQSQIIKVYKQKENPAALEEEKRKTLEIVNIINNKKGSCSICPPVNVVKADAWYGKSSDGNNEYEAGNMYWNGTIFGVLEAPGGEETITIQAKGSPAEGIYPYMVVAVDGDEISEALIASQDWKDYSFKVKTDAGPKVLSVIFLNDGGNPNANEDRNLYIGQARITKNE